MKVVVAFGRFTICVENPATTGAAIAAYLEHERPKTNNRAVFVRHHTPRGEPVGPDLVRKAMGSRAVFVDAGARWRQKPPSPRAVAAAQKWRLPDVGSYTTAGALSDALDAHIQRVKARRTAKR